MALHFSRASPGFPWPSPVDDLGLVGAVDGRGQDVVVLIADAADRWLDAGQTPPPSARKRLDWVIPQETFTRKLAANTRTW
ncbi:hypothetical protein GE253_23230 [Niveispirillum sp. SYP-B3756]|nr:hypothetical protein [Niveispirillum sp. SYP-B3756]